MPDIAICPQCENAHWADKPHGCGVEHDRLEAQASVIKDRLAARDVIELVQRCSQLKWLASCVTAKGRGLPSRQQWASLYRLAEGALPLAEQTLAAFPLAVRELEKEEHRYRAGLASGMSAFGQDREAGLEAKPASPTGAAGDAQPQSPNQEPS